jgi:hypothetical protein
LWISKAGADALQRLNDVLGAVAKARIKDRREAREGVDHSEYPDLFAGCQLVTNEVHRPALVRLRRQFSIIPKIRLDPALGRLVPQLKVQLILDPMRLFMVDLQAFAAQQHVPPAIAITHARRTNLLKLLARERGAEDLDGSANRQRLVGVCQPAVRESLASGGQSQAGFQRQPECLTYDAHAC